MSEDLVEFRNVSFRYDEASPWVLRHCTFSIREQESIAIIGHNGSGKSTIAKLMNGLLFPQEGEIRVKGQPVDETTIWEVRRDVGMVFQNPDNQFVGTTVQDDVAFGMENRGFPREDMVRLVEKTLKSVGMYEELLTEPHRLSGGQKQRVAIASILAVSPTIMILDEATAMLDPQGRKSIMDTIAALFVDKAMTLVTITHDLDEVLDTERVIVMNQGGIWKEGTPRDIFSNHEAFHQIGLAQPFVGKLAEELRQTGISIPHEPLSHEELLKTLWTFHSNT